MPVLHLFLCLMHARILQNCLSVYMFINVNLLWFLMCGEPNSSAGISICFLLTAAFPVLALRPLLVSGARPGRQQNEYSFCSQSCMYVDAFISQWKHFRLKSTGRPQRSWSAFLLPPTERLVQWCVALQQVPHNICTAGDS